MSLTILKMLALTEVRLRMRRTSTLVALLAVVALSWLMIADPASGEALITADHGNCEQMSDESTGQAHTAHTTEPVPFIYVGKRDFKVREGGVLADVAPTMLMLMGLKKPAEMTGTSILV